MNRPQLTIKTHRSLPEDLAKDGEEACEFCQRPARYWSQAGLAHKSLSRDIPHCQRHRAEARVLCEAEAGTPGIYEQQRRVRLAEMVAEDPTLLEIPDVRKALFLDEKEQAMNKFKVEYANCIVYVGGHRCSPSPLATRCYNAILEAIGQARDAVGTITIGAAGQFSFQEAV